MKTVYFNLNLDDIHPETSKGLADCGGERAAGVFKYLFQLIALHPSIKMTLFTTPNWINKSKAGFFVRNIQRLFGRSPGTMWHDEPFKLTKHPDWCAWLAKQKNFEIAVHGYTHYAQTRSYAQEFKDLPYAAAKERLVKAEQIFTDAQLPFVRGFRPPGWGVSPGLFKALQDLHYAFISGNYTAGVGMYQGLVNVPQNWDIAKGTIEDAVKLIEQGMTFLSAKGHIAQRYGNDYMANGLTEKTYQNIVRLLQYLMAHYKVQFVTMQEMAKKYKKRKK